MVKNTIINRITIVIAPYSIDDNDTNNCDAMMFDNKTITYGSV